MSYTPRNRPPAPRRSKGRSAALLLLLSVALVGTGIAALWLLTTKSLTGGEQSIAPSESLLVGADAQVSTQPPSETAASSSSAAGASGASSVVTGENLPESGDWQLALVNPTHKLQDDYPVELRAVVGDYMLDARIVADMQAMLAAAKADGYSLQLCSAYRSIDRSRILYTNKVNQLINSGLTADDAAVEAARWVAPPGTSEHNTGLAADIVSADYFTKYAELEHDFETFDEFTWLYENCAEYGFVLRFPKDKQDITGITYEPWHYRYVGKEHAKKMMDQKICLEEYLNIF